MTREGAGGPFELVQEVGELGLGEFGVGEQGDFQSDRQRSNRSAVGGGVIVVVADEDVDDAVALAAFKEGFDVGLAAFGDLADLGDGQAVGVEEIRGAAGGEDGDVVVVKALDQREQTTLVGHGAGADQDALGAALAAELEFERL